jgi:hypothetical protein
VLLAEHLGAVRPVSSQDCATSMPEAYSTPGVRLHIQSNDSGESGPTSGRSRRRVWRFPVAVLISALLVYGS